MPGGAQGDIITKNLYLLLHLILFYFGEQFPPHTRKKPVSVSQDFFVVNEYSYQEMEISQYLLSV